MAAVVEVPEVRVTGELIPVQELDRVRRAVCLLTSSNQEPGSGSWTATGFYINMKLKMQNKLRDVHCIITNYHVFQKKEENSDGMVAVFHHESTEKENDVNKIPLVPLTIFASNKDLDYVLIRVDKSLMRSVGVCPILADASNLPEVRSGDSVYIIQHPEGLAKHFSKDTVKHVNPPFIEYYADTSFGSSGSPVLVLVDSKFSLVALHCKGVMSTQRNWNKGVLLSEILGHLQTGKCSVLGHVCMDLGQLFTLEQILSRLVNRAIVPLLFIALTSCPRVGYDQILSWVHVNRVLQRDTKPVLSMPVIPSQLESGAVVPAPILGTKDPSKKVTNDDIRFIAKDIISEFWTLGAALGLSDSTLKIINADYYGDAYSKCYRMLIKWTEIMASNATYGNLSKAFADPTVERFELIEKYC